ncbi:Protein CYP-14A3 [Aphelenchoides avenae]|nr:Protein CYP-14A3 [Aphelenchus avenae]
MILILLFTLLCAYVVWFYWNVSRYPRGPFPLPFIGNLHQLWNADPAAFFDENAPKYGHVFTVFMPTPTVVLSTYESIKEALVLTDHFNGKPTGDMDFLSFEKNGGIIMSVGDNWREQRRLSLTILRDFGMGKAIMEEKTMRSVQNLLERLDAIEEKDAVDMHWPIQMCVGNVLNEVLFDYSFSDMDKLKGFVEMMHDFINMFLRYELQIIISYPKLHRLPYLREVYEDGRQKSKKYYDFIEANVKAQQAEFSPDAPATTFVQAYLKEMEKGQSPYTNYKQLVSVASDMWLAAMETTSITLRWAIVYSLKWPEIQEKLYAEIEREIGSDRFPTMADKPNLPYLNAFILETMRYSNITTFEIRATTTDVDIMGHRIPKDTMITPQYCRVLAKDPVFVDPNEFRPERFLEDDGKPFNKAAVERLVAFGMGKRQCPGEGLARMQLFLIFTTLLQRYRFVANGEVDLTPDAGLIRTPKDHACRVVSRI